MNYTASVSDFFKSPKWMMNLLLGGVCVLIPIVGPIVVLGWLITGFWARQDENFETFPDFDFSHFGKYLERGLWPFLVAFVVGVGLSIVLVPLVWILMIPAMLIGGGLSSGGDPNLGGCLGCYHYDCDDADLGRCHRCDDAGAGAAEDTRFPHAGFCQVV